MTGQSLPAVRRPVRHDAIDALAGLGRWSLARGASQLVPVRDGAAPAGHGAGRRRRGLSGWCRKIARWWMRRWRRWRPDDAAVGCEFRLVEREHGVRWLRLQSVAAAGDRWCTAC
jgi:hypothetical protein